MRGWLGYHGCVMSPGPPLAPVKLVRKRLDGDGVGEHLAALARDARSMEVRVKAAPTVYSEAAEAGPAGELGELARRLRAGEVAAVQLRYLLDGAWWTDTIVRRGDDFRLVRMQDEEPPG